MSCSRQCSATVDDTTPEVFFLTGLLDLQDYERVRKVLEDLKVKQRTQPAYEAVVEHFGRLLAEASPSPRQSAVAIRPAVFSHDGTKNTTLVRLIRPPSLTGCAAAFALLEEPLADPLELLDPCPIR